MRQGVVHEEITLNAVLVLLVLPELMGCCQREQDGSRPPENFVFVFVFFPLLSSVKGLLTAQLSLDTELRLVEEF